MGLQVQVTLQLQAGPAAVADSSFPSGVLQINAGLNPTLKPYGVSTGAVVTIAQAPPGFQTIDSIGVGGQVTQVTTFYCRTQALMELQLTFADPNGGPDIVSKMPLNGVYLAEFPTNGYLKALGVQGAGPFEYWASGTV